MIRKDDPGASEGGEFRDSPIPTSLMNKPPKKYLANESTPADNMNAEPVGESFDNPGDLSKKFA